jgi:cytosine/adenosine deaminase-related metal-dependent hydrolase
MTSSPPILLRNCTAVATMNDARAVLRDVDVLLAGPRIAAIGAGLNADGAECIDCRGKVVLPGLVNTHHHLYQVLTRNLPAAQNAKLFDWLVYHYEIWRGVTPEAVYAAARCGLAELLLTGCTTSADHHYLFPRGASAYLIDEEIRAACELGIRFHPTRGSMTRGRTLGGLPPDDVVQTPAEILRDSLRVIEQYHDPAPLSMCRLALAPCSPFSVTPEIMRATAVLAREKGVQLHTHLCETLDEEQYCLDTCGMRPLEYMDSVGWLGDDVWYAHGIYFNDAEIAQLGHTGTGIAHCPTSNLRLGSGIAPVRALRQAGAPVGIAVDGSASNDGSNMLLEVRMAMLVQRIKAGVDAMPALDALWLATRGGAAVLGRDDIGMLAPGMAADLAVFDISGLAHAGAQSDPVAAVLFCGMDQRAWLTMVNGVVVVRDKQLVQADANAIAAAANAAAKLLCT